MSIRVNDLLSFFLPYIPREDLPPGSKPVPHLVPGRCTHGRPLVPIRLPTVLTWFWFEEKVEAREDPGVEGDLRSQSTQVRRSVRQGCPRRDRDRCSGPLDRDVGEGSTAKG